MNKRKNTPAVSGDNENEDKEDNHDYQPVDVTKRSVHKYNAFRQSMPPKFPSEEDDGAYIDCRARSKTLPTEELGEYVELDYQRSRKGKPRTKSMEDVDKARSLAVRKVQDMKEQESTPVVYSYPRAVLAPKPRGNKNKSIPEISVVEEDDDGYVQTNEKKKPKKGKVVFAKEPPVDHEGYVDCEIVEEHAKPKEKKKTGSKSSWFHLKKPNKKKHVPEISTSEDDNGYVQTTEKKKPNKRDMFAKQGSVDHEGYVDCETTEKKKPNKRDMLAKQGSVDHEGYVDCEIVEASPEQSSSTKSSWYHLKKANKPPNPNISKTK